MTSDNPRSLSADNGLVRAGALAIYTAGGLFWAFMPYFVGLQTDSGNFSPTQAGSLGSGYLAGFTIASVTALWWAPRFNLRLTALTAVVLVLVALFLLQDTTQFGTSLASVAFIGIFMGALWTMAYRIFSMSSNPDRSFALGIVVSYTTLAVISYIVGLYVVPQYGLSGAAMVIGGVMLLLGFGGLLLPSKLAVPGAQATKGYRPSRSLIFALVGIMTTSFAFASIWAYAERIGVDSGIARSAIAPIIATNLLASGAGSLLAIALGTKFGRRCSLFAGLITMVVTVLLLSGAGNLSLYAVAIIGLGFGVGFVMPYQMATLSVLDKQGSFVVLIVAAQGFGSAAGPVLGGLASDAGGMRLLVAMTISGLILSAIMFLLIDAKQIAGQLS